MSFSLSTSTGAPAFEGHHHGAGFTVYDLSAHRATNFPRLPLQPGDLLLAMEVRHAHELVRRGIPADAGGAARALVASAPNPHPRSAPAIPISISGPVSRSSIPGGQPRRRTSPCQAGSPHASSHECLIWLRHRSLVRRLERSRRKFPASLSVVYDAASPKATTRAENPEILARNGLKGVFFVEPLFAARFGVDALAVIVDLIRAGGHDIQLHLPRRMGRRAGTASLPFAGASRKRQHLAFYTLDEQIALIRLGLDLMAPGRLRQDHRLPCRRSFASNADTYRANCAPAASASTAASRSLRRQRSPDLRGSSISPPLQAFEGVSILPMTVFRDGTGRLRPAQLGACSCRTALLLNRPTRGQYRTLVVLSHNFEMLRQGSSVPDAIVAGRFEALCRISAPTASGFRGGDGYR